MRRAPAKGIGALVLLTVSFAMTTVLARFLNNGFTILQQVYLRAAVAFCFAVLAFGRRIRWRVILRAPPGEWYVIVARTVLLYVIGTTLFSKAATLAPVGDVSFIAALPFVSVLGLALRRVPVTRRRAVCVLGCTIGAGALSGFGTGAQSGAASLNRGDLLAAVSMLAIAASYLGRAWHHSDLNNSEITVLTIAVGAVIIAMASFALGQGLPAVHDTSQSLGHSPSVLWSAVLLAGVLNVLNVFLINYGFEHVDAVRAGNLLTLECVWGLALGLLFFDQRPTPAELVGGLLIVLSAVGLNSTSAEVRS